MQYIPAENKPYYRGLSLAEIRRSGFGCWVFGEFQRAISAGEVRRLNFEI